MGLFKLPSFIPAFVPRPKDIVNAAKKAASPLAAVRRTTGVMTHATKVVVSKAPKRGIIGHLNAITVAQVGRVETSAKQVERGDVRGATKTAGIIALDSGQQSHGHSLATAKKYPAVRKVIGAVGLFVPVVAAVSAVLEVSIAQDELKLRKLRAKQEKEESAAVEAEIAIIEKRLADKKAKQNLNNPANARHDGTSAKTPPFADSVEYAYTEAFRKLKTGGK